MKAGTRLKLSSLAYKLYTHPPPDTHHARRFTLSLVHFVFCLPPFSVQLATADNSRVRRAVGCSTLAGFSHSAIGTIHRQSHQTPNQISILAIHPRLGAFTLPSPCYLHSARSHSPPTSHTPPLPPAHKPPTSPAPSPRHPLPATLTSEASGRAEQSSSLLVAPSVPPSPPLHQTALRPRDEIFLRVSTSTSKDASKFFRALAPACDVSA